MVTPILKSLRSRLSIPDLSLDHLPLVVLDRRVREEAPAHGVNLVGAIEFHLYEPTDVDALGTPETKRRKCALYGLALGVQNSGLRAHEDADLQSTAPLWVISLTLRSISA